VVHGIQRRQSGRADHAARSRYRIRHRRKAGCAAGPDGNLWFTENVGNRIGRITPAGVITEFEAGISPDARLFGIAAGPDGNLWFTEQLGNQIGRIKPNGAVTEFFVCLSFNADPSGITAGPDGNMWFAEGGGGIGRITVDDDVIFFDGFDGPCSE
jgi:virginiamycin B lyase